MKYLNEYDNFILEKLILESNVIYSDKFKKALTKIPENSIAVKLLEIENKDLDIVSNFFDIKIDNDSILTFTSDRIAQQILNEDKEFVKYNGGRGGWLTNNITLNAVIFAKLGFEPKSEEVYAPNNNDVGEIISKVLSEKSGKTWCYVKFQNGEGVYNLEKLTITQKDLKNSVFKTNRQEIRIGRAVRVLLRAYNISITDSNIETFVNEFRAVLAIMNNVFSRFEIVEGDDLGFWYHRNNYEHPHKGNLGSSCKAVGRLDWLEIYIKNPQAVKLLILKSELKDDKICGRSLLWKLDDGRILMDTIYVNKDSDVNVFREYGNVNNYIQINYSDTFVAHINPGTLDKYPSIDHMHYLDHNTGKISNNDFPGSTYVEWDDDGEEWVNDDWDNDDDDDD